MRMLTPAIYHYISCLGNVMVSRWMAAALKVHLGSPREVRSNRAGVKLSADTQLGTAPTIPARKSAKFAIDKLPVEGVGETVAATQAWRPGGVKLRRCNVADLEDNFPFHRE